MSRIAAAFKKCAAENRRAVIPYLTAGFPDEQTFVSVVSSFGKQGADIIEIGIPFSDPLADGPTIQYSSHHALQRGMTVAKTLSLLRQLRDKRPPLLIMSYLNPLLQFGFEKFVKQASGLGVAGLIIPDIIVEEAGPYETTSAKHGVDLIHLMAPTSSPQRQRQILQRSRGFVYLVSVMGVTGARRSLPRGLNTWIGDIKEQSSIPVAVGFGISGPDAARSVASVADGIIVGSAIIDILKNGENPSTAVQQATAFLGKLQAAVRRNGG